MEQPLLQGAARVANQFQIDPVTVLESTYFDYAVRLAAHNYIQREIAKEREKQNQKK